MDRKVIDVSSLSLSLTLTIYLPTYLSTNVSIDLFIYLPIYLSISLSLSVCLSIYLSICKLENQAILRDVFIVQSWQHQKRSNSARLPQCLNLTTSKTKQFCETSSFFKVDNIQNAAIQRDFLNLCIWQHQNQSNSARLIKKWKVECSADSLVPMRLAIFPVHLSKVLRLPRKSDARSYDVLHLSCKIILANLQNPTDLMLQNATPLKKSAPWPPNISHEHVFCIAPATENASLQILFKCPTPAIVSGNAAEPSRFAQFWQGAKSLAPATRNELWISKSGPRMVCFVHFDLEMCFAPQRRALSRHLNLQKWSEPLVLLTFWLRNVLRATTACTFSTSQLPKVVRQWRALYILTWKSTSRHNAVQFFISHLASWLRTRRFSESTFRPSGAQNHWKNTVFRDFPTFSRICIFFLLTLSLLLFFLLVFLFSLPLPCSAFHLSILSEVWLLNFLRWIFLHIFTHLHTTKRLSCWPDGVTLRIGRGDMCGEDVFH